MESYIIYKFDRYTEFFSMPDPKHDDGSVDFGVVGCDQEVEVIYIKRRHLKRNEWCMDENEIKSFLANKGKNEQSPSTEAKYGEDVVRFSKDKAKVGLNFNIKGNVLYGPFDVLPEHWDKLAVVESKDKIEYRAVDTKAMGEGWNGLFFRAKKGEVDPDAINLLNLGGRFDQTKFTCFAKGDYYYGYLSPQHTAAKPSEVASWTALKKVERLDLYINLVDIAQKLFEYGYAHNNLLIEKFLRNGKEFIIRDFSCAKLIGDQDKLCGHPVNHIAIRKAENWKANYYTDLYSLVFIILQIESGKTLDDLLKDGNGQPVDLNQIYAHENNAEPTKFMINLAKKVMTPKWGAPDESISVMSSQFGKSPKNSIASKDFAPDINISLSTAVVTIINEVNSLPISYFRQYLQALKDRTPKEELI